MPGIITASFIAVIILIVILLVLRLRHVSLQNLIIGIIGAITGLLLGALASVPLSNLPEPYGGILPIVISAAVTIVIFTVVVIRRDALLAILPWLKLSDSTDSPRKMRSNSVEVKALVDTSAIIDGRIADIAEAGFGPRHLIVPRFVLAELQNIADSEDAMRRGRGRRGLEVLNRLREVEHVEVEVTDEDVSSIKEVDAKLVALAQKFNCDVLTTDYNLNRVAVIQGVRILNVNELSNAIRPVVIPGEQLLVHVVQPGKERGQGVGYLADGTMIVVDGGDNLIGQDVMTEVTRVFQTVAGKMIFAVPLGSTPTPDNSNFDAGQDIAVETQSETQASPKARSNRNNRGSRGRKPQNNSKHPKNLANQSKSIEDRLVEENNSGKSTEQ